MDQELARVLALVSTYSILLPSGLCLALILKKQASREQIILGVLLLCSIVTEGLSIYMGQYLGLNNLPLLHLFTVVQFFLLAMIYRGNLHPYITNRQIDFLIIGFAVFAIFNSILNESIFQFNPVARAVKSLIVIAFVLTYFYKLLQELKIRRLESLPLFWISTGLLIYFSSNLFVFIFSNYILPSSYLTFTFWGIHAVMSILINLFYTLALWAKPEKPK
ncbi:MAG: hypothetical protein AAFP19_22375 [Bacteroidota bacterium]